MILDLTSGRHKDLIAQRFSEVKTVGDGADLEEFASAQAVLLDERSRLTPELLGILPADLRVYAVYEGYVFGLPEKDIEDYQRKAMEEKRWYVLKDLNKIKIKANLIWRQAKIETYPVVLQVESTSLCNARCIMCSHRYKDPREGKHLDLGAKSTLEKIVPYVETVMLHGIGEPFLNPDIIEWLRFYKSYGVHLSTFTNMSILSPELLKAIGESFSSLHISCDGCTEEIFEAIRGNLKFSVFTENVRLLHKSYPDLRLCMHVVAMRQNLNQIKDFVAFAHELGFESVTFSNLTVNPLLKNGGDSLRNFPVSARRGFEEAARLGTELGVRVSFPPEYLKYEDDSEEYEREQKKFRQTPLFEDGESLKNRVAKLEEQDLYATERLRVEDVIQSDYECLGLCDWLCENAYLDLEGNLAMCCSKYYLTMGNIKEQNHFQDAWNSPQYQSMRKMFFCGKIPLACQGCRYLIDGTLKNATLTNYDLRFRDVQNVSALAGKLAQAD